MLPVWRAACLAALTIVCVRLLAADASVLKPPPGAKVAIVMFEDLECPECANAYSLVWEAANAHKIPVVLHDFPLPRHSWSFEAAVWARYFDNQDTPATSIGNEFRGYAYANQKQITRENLQQWVQRFADEHKIALPGDRDPHGKLAEIVRADFALAQRIGVEHSPTIWVITHDAVSQPLVEEVKDRQQLNQMIEDMLNKARQTQPVASPRVRKSSAKHAPNQSKHGVKR
jgi:protein-disulfide isomerase